MARSKRLKALAEAQCKEKGLKNKKPLLSDLYKIIDFKLISGPKTFFFINRSSDMTFKVYQQFVTIP